LRRPEIVLFKEEIIELEKIIATPKSEQRSVQRAMIILLSARGNMDNKRIAAELNITAKTVGKWQKQYLQYGITGLEYKPRSGRPNKTKPIQRAEIIAIACDLPKNYGHETHTLWTNRALTKTVNEEVEGLDISTATVHRILNKNALKPHKTKAWLHSKDPQFKEKTNEVVELYLNPVEDSAVICVDEKPMQATEHKNELRLPEPEIAAKKEYEYIRHGTQALIAGFNIANGQVTAQCNDTRKASDLLEYMEFLALEYSWAEKVHIIWDNLNIHHNGPDLRWDKFNEIHGGKFVFHYTPLHASWVNQVEIFFSILHRRILKHGSFTSTTDLKNKVMKFINLWNKVEGHAFNWTFGGYPNKKKEA
jgi:transposase